MIFCAIILIILLIVFYSCTNDIFLSILASVFGTFIITILTGLLASVCFFIEIPNEPKTVVIESAYVKFDDKVHKYARDKFNIDTTIEPNIAKIESCRIDHPDWMYWVISPCVNIANAKEVVNKISINPND